MKKLTVVIVSYNVEDYLYQCLHSVYKALQDVDAEVYVVDNHSHDNTVEMVRREFPDVVLVASNHNLGFSRANNIAIRQSDSEYVLLLNPDTIVGEHTLSDSVAFMDAHPKAGGLGVRMMSYDGQDARESRRGLPTPTVSFYKMSGLCNRFPRSRRFGKYYMGYLPWDEPAQIEVVSGAYFMLRRKAIDEVGLLDEDFFMYGEDIDLSYRLLKGGYENWYLPTRILHYKGESTQRSSFRYVHVFYEAMLIFFRKHYSQLSLLLSIPIKLAIYAKATIELLRLQIQKAKRSMGFVRQSKDAHLAYVFIGEEAAIETCRRLAQEKGLNATFYEGNQQTNPEGHHQMELPENRLVYVVYDTSAYSFEAIFNIFARKAESQVSIGTFIPKTGTIITTEEIFK